MRRLLITILMLALMLPAAAAVDISQVDSLYQDINDEIEAVTNELATDPDLPPEQLALLNKYLGETTPENSEAMTDILEKQGMLDKEDLGDETEKGKAKEGGINVLYIILLFAGLIVFVVIYTARHKIASGAGKVRDWARKKKKQFNERHAMVRKNLTILETLKAYTNEANKNAEIAKKNKEYKSNVLALRACFPEEFLKVKDKKLIHSNFTTREQDIAYCRADVDDLEDFYIELRAQLIANKKKPEQMNLWKDNFDEECMQLAKKSFTKAFSAPITEAAKNLTTLEKLTKKDITTAKAAKTGEKDPDLRLKRGQLEENLEQQLESIQFQQKMLHIIAMMMEKKLFEQHEIDDKTTKYEEQANKLYNLALQEQQIQAEINILIEDKAKKTETDNSKKAKGASPAAQNNTIINAPAKAAFVNPEDKDKLIIVKLLKEEVTTDAAFDFEITMPDGSKNTATIKVPALKTSANIKVETVPGKHHIKELPHPDFECTKPKKGETDADKLADQPKIVTFNNDRK